MYILYFSPVGSTKRVAEAICQSMEGITKIWVDLSNPSMRGSDMNFQSCDTVLMAFPVYAGRVARVPRYFFKKIFGGGAQAITVVTYGNRAYDDALLELSKLASDAGFRQIAAAAFVCEHSFGIGLATGRPDDNDLKVANTFGIEVLKRMNGELMISEDLSIPGCFPFRTQFRHDFGGPLVPMTSSACNDCGLCYSQCPVEAIPYGEPQSTDSKKCIACFRCIRSCPSHARKITLTDFVTHADWLSKEFQARKEAELFL